MSPRVLSSHGDGCATDALETNHSCHQANRVDEELGVGGVAAAALGRGWDTELGGNVVSHPSYASQSAPPLRVGCREGTSGSEGPRRTTGIAWKL